MWRKYKKVLVNTVDSSSFFIINCTLCLDIQTADGSCEAFTAFSPPVFFLSQQSELCVCRAARKKTPLAFDSQAKKKIHSGLNVSNCATKASSVLLNSPRA